MEPHSDGDEWPDVSAGQQGSSVRVPVKWEVSMSEATATPPPRLSRPRPARKTASVRTTCAKTPEAPTSFGAQAHVADKLFRKSLRTPTGPVSPEAHSLRGQCQKLEARNQELEAVLEGFQAMHDDAVAQLHLEAEASRDGAESSARRRVAELESELRLLAGAGAEDEKLVGVLREQVQHLEQREQQLLKAQLSEQRLAENSSAALEKATVKIQELETSIHELQQRLQKSQEDTQQLREQGGEELAWLERRHALMCLRHGVGHWERSRVAQTWRLWRWGSLGRCWLCRKEGRAVGGGSRHVEQSVRGDDADVARVRAVFTYFSTAPTPPAGAAHEHTAAREHAVVSRAQLLEGIEAGVLQRVLPWDAQGSTGLENGFGVLAAGTGSVGWDEFASAFLPGRGTQRGGCPVSPEGLQQSLSSLGARCCSLEQVQQRSKLTAQQLEHWLKNSERLQESELEQARGMLAKAGLEERAAETERAVSEQQLGELGCETRAFEEALSAVRQQLDAQEGALPPLYGCVEPRTLEDLGSRSEMHRKLELQAKLRIELQLEELSAQRQHTEQQLAGSTSTIVQKKLNKQLQQSTQRMEQLRHALQFVRSRDACWALGHALKSSKLRRCLYKLKELAAGSMRVQMGHSVCTLVGHKRSLRWLGHWRHVACVASQRRGHARCVEHAVGVWWEQRARLKWLCSWRVLFWCRTGSVASRAHKISQVAARIALGKATQRLTGLHLGFQMLERGVAQAELQQAKQQPEVSTSELQQVVIDKDAALEQTRAEFEQLDQASKASAAEFETKMNKAKEVAIALRQMLGEETKKSAQLESQLRELSLESSKAHRQLHVLSTQLSQNSPDQEAQEPLIMRRTRSQLSPSPVREPPETGTKPSLFRRTNSASWAKSTRRGTSVIDQDAMLVAEISGNPIWRP